MHVTCSVSAANMCLTRTVRQINKGLSPMFLSRRTPFICVL